MLKYHLLDEILMCVHVVREFSCEHMVQIVSEKTSNFKAIPITRLSFCKSISQWFVFE